MSVLAFSAANAGEQVQLMAHPSGSPHELSLPPTPDYRYAPIPGDGYPAVSIRQHHEGSVDVLATLDSNGKVIEIRVNQSSGYLELDRAAMKTVQARQFPPCAHTNQWHEQCLVVMLVVFHLPQP
jgi:TonB family protein